MGRSSKRLINGLTVLKRRKAKIKRRNVSRLWLAKPKPRVY
jgi:hypothetical protein